MESNLIYYLSSIQNKNIKNENENDHENENENGNDNKNENESENENEKIFTANHPASKYSFNTRNINKMSQQISIS